MAKIKFIVRAKLKEQPAIVYVRYYHGKKVDISVPTELMVYPEMWINKSQAFRQRMFYDGEVFTEKDRHQLEDNFRDLKSEIIIKVNSGVSITKEILTRIVQDYHHPPVPDRKMTLSQFIDNFIDDIETGRRLTEKKRVFGSGTVRAIRGFRSQFNKFQMERDAVLDFGDINMDFYEDFIRFFNKKNYSPNTIGKHVKHLKMMMSAALNKGFHNNTEFQRRLFKPPSSEVSSIYLSEIELRKMFDLDLYARPHMEHARDVFLIGCYTAQRFSDYSRIRSENIKNGFIELIQQKTGEEVVIPIRPELEFLLKKHNYTVPKTYEQKVNARIKKVGELAGIDETVISESYKGGMKVEVSLPKYELIKTHTARRSGCTNMYLAGIPPIDIMKISGHKTESEFLKYIRVTKRETAEGLANHPYFIGSPLKIAK